MYGWSLAPESSANGDSTLLQMRLTKRWMFWKEVATVTVHATANAYQLMQFDGQKLGAMAFHQLFEDLKHVHIFSIDSRMPACIWYTICMKHCCRNELPVVACH